MEAYEAMYKPGNGHCTHEVILDWMPQKPKFDIDGGNVQLFDDFVEVL